MDFSAGEGDLHLEDYANVVAVVVVVAAAVAAAVVAVAAAATGHLVADGRNYQRSERPLCCHWDPHIGLHCDILDQPSQILKSI